MPNFKEIEKVSILLKVDVDILNDYEKQKCIEAFNIYDKNGSKRLEKEELRIVLEGILNLLEMGHNPTDEELVKMISDVDQTGDGAISK